MRSFEKLKKKMKSLFPPTPLVLKLLFLMVCALGRWEGGRATESCCGRIGSPPPSLLSNCSFHISVPQKTRLAS